MSTECEENDLSDAFACFGDDDEDEEEMFTSIEDAHHRSHLHTRDPSCGVLSFRAGTESSLLAHVANSIKCRLSSPEKVLLAIDEYCRTRHWMMHVGPEKKAHLKKALEKALIEHKDGGSQSVVAVEMGTYCGYSAIVIGDILRGEATKYGSSNEAPRFHLYSFEICQDFARVSREMVRLAGLEDFVTITLLGKNEIASDCLTSCRYCVDQIRFLFLDHDKDQYLRDLISFQNSGLLAMGSVVVADNVVFCGIDDYVDYVASLEQKKVITNITVNCMVEYVNDDADADEMKDAMVVSTYIRDPCKVHAELNSC